MAERAEYNLDETKPQKISLDTGEDSIVEASMIADVPTTVHIDASIDGRIWYDDIDKMTNVTKYHKGFFNTRRFIRMRTEAAGAVGDKVSLILTSRRM
ncbi:MAG: hypothetical protein JRE40_03315 [Deltaproteobacteria bacterium]|nr:hypothetical protein [Deltaproteobacteria bacterium]MBW2672973.1 hypothetical protein [Deltaproteobacteria bacterium]